MKLNKEQIKILEKYNINYKVDSLRELLINIDYVMTEYVDEQDEPLEQFLELERVCNEIYFENKEEYKV